MKAWDEPSSSAVDEGVDHRGAVAAGPGGGSGGLAELEARLAAGDGAALATLEEGLSAGAPWAEALLRARIEARVAWAKRAMVLGLRAERAWAWRCYQAWFHPMVVKICRARLGDDGLASDCAAIVRERFVAHNAHLERPLQTFPGYLYTMASHAAIKWARDRSRWTSWEGDGASGAVAGPLAAPPLRPDEALAAAERRALAARLRAQVEALAPEQRALLRDRFEGGKTFKVMAEERGCTHQNVDQRIRRILAKLRGALGRGEERGDDA